MALTLLTSVTLSTKTASSASGTESKSMKISTSKILKNLLTNPRVKAAPFFYNLFKVSFLELIKLVNDFDFNIVYELGDESENGIRRDKLKDDRIRRVTNSEHDNREIRSRQH